MQHLADGGQTGVDAVKVRDVVGGIKGHVKVNTDEGFAASEIELVEGQHIFEDGLGTLAPPGCTTFGLLKHAQVNTSLLVLGGGDGRTNGVSFQKLLTESQLTS